jgi:hypothetical protein
VGFCFFLTPKVLSETDASEKWHQYTLFVHSSF